VFDRDLAIQRGRQPEHDAALHLRFERVGVRDLAAVHDTHYAMHAYRPVRRHRNFGDLSASRGLPFGNRNPAAATRWQWRAPAGLGRGQLERAEMARLGLQQLTPKLVRIAASGSGDLEHEALDDIRG